MVGDGSKIGGPAGVPLPVVSEEPRPAESRAGPAKVPAKVAGDSFVKNESRPQIDKGPRNQAPVPLAREMSGSTDVLRLARENPPAARQLAASLAAQSASTLSEIEKARVGARAVLEQLANERFTKAALRQVAEELKRRREKIAGLKLRHSMAARKMALLQQLAGKLGDPRLDEEIDRILSHHKKLKTAWAKRHHLLSIGASLFGDSPDTPEHLQQVIKAGVRPGADGEELGDVLEEISPRAVIAELIARTIDGSTRDASGSDEGAVRGELGKTPQSAALLYDLIEASLDDDPFGEG